MNYTPRAGSTAYLALQHLQAYGRTGELALASAIDKELHEIAPLLGWAMKAGAISRQKVGGEWVYRLGDGEPVAPAAAQIEISKMKAPGAGPSGGGSQKPNGAGHSSSTAHARAGSNTPQGDQPRFERGREVMEPKACESADGRGTNGAPALATLPHNASPVVGPMGAWQPADAGPIEASHPVTPQMRCALWSDGSLHIQRGVEVVELCADETRELVRYLDRLSEVA